MSIASRLEQAAAWLLPFHPAFGLVAVAGLSFRGRRVWRGLKQQKGDLILFGLLALVGIISAVGAYNHQKAVINWFVPFLFMWIYALGRWAVDSPTRFLRAMLHGTAAFALVMIVGALLQLDVRIGDFIVLGRFAQRGVVLGIKSNGLASVLEAGVIGGIGLFIIAGRRRERIEGLVIAILSLIATGITLSRGAMVGIAVGAVALGILLSPKALFTGALTSGAALALSPTLRTRALSIFDLSRHEARISIWKGTLRMLKDHLWFGVGPGNFREAYPTYSDPKWAHAVSAHNNYLYFTSAWGLLGGLLFFGWQAWVMIRTLLRGASPYQRIMIAILITFGTHVLFDDLMTAYAALLLGCMENPAYDGPAAEAEAE